MTTQTHPHPSIREVQNMTDQTLTTAPTGADRRGFLRRAGTVTAVAAVAAGAHPTLASAAPAAQPSTAPEDLNAAFTSTGAHLFYVKDAARGQLAVLVGEREVTYTDKAFTLALLQAAGR
jgi:anti-sigma-K factor RskA